MSDKWIDFSTRTPICIKISSSKTIFIKHERLKNQIEVLFPLKGFLGVAKKWGDWIIECREDSIYLYVCDDKLNDVIHITLDDIYSGIQIREEKHQGKVYELFEVQKLDFSSKGVLVSVSGNVKAEQNVEEKKQLKDNVNRENSQSVIDVISVSEHGRLMAEKDRSIVLINQKLADCQAENKKLQYLLEDELKSILNNLSDDYLTLTTEQKSILLELKSKDNENIELQNSIEELREKIKKIEEDKAALEELKAEERIRLEQTIENLNGVKEAVDMSANDVASFQKEIQELARRAQLDSETLLLLEDGTDLKNNSVMETMESINMAIEASERRIRLIIESLIHEVTDANTIHADMISYYDELERIQVGLKEEGYVNISSFSAKVRDMNAQARDLMASYDKLLYGITRDVEELQKKVMLKLKSGMSK